MAFVSCTLKTCKAHRTSCSSICVAGWGGPALYVQEYGHPMLRRRHLPFSISESERDQWLLCMDSALHEEVENTVLCQELSAAFAKVAEHMRNEQ